MLLKDYSENQIKNLVEIIRDCALEGRYIISFEDNKFENIQFIQEYNINENKRIHILFNLKYTNFCYGLQNMKEGIEQNNLYVFCSQEELYNIEGIKELVDIYLKFNIIHSDLEEYRIIVSMHKRNKPSTYLFK